MAPASVTQTQIRMEQAQVEDRLLAQAALEGERVVTYARVAFVALVGLATNVGKTVAGEQTGESGYRMALVGAYIVFAFTALFFTHWVKKGSPRKAMIFPFLWNAVDFGFLAANGWIHTHVLHLEPLPHMAAASSALVLCFSVSRYSPWHIGSSVAGAIATVTGVAWMQGWLSLASGGFVASCYVALGVLIYLTNRRIKRLFVEVRSHENLSRYLPRQVVDRVLKAAGAPLRPVQREVTVLFSDIRGFTALSEKLPPGEVLRFLDEYFGHMVQIVKGHEGMLNKFLGDGLLAVWGVPEPQADHAERALKAALDMTRALKELNVHRLRSGQAELRIGIGVHSGVVAAGMLGGTEQREYAVIGDAVNLASRIEGLTKEVGCAILASERAWTLGGGKLTGERVGAEKVKGRQEAVVVYAVREAA